MTVECISNENGKLRKFFPINIDKKKIANLSSNLSKFQYKFGNIHQVTTYRNKKEKGIITMYMNITNGNVKMATMGTLNLEAAFIFIKSYNQYDGTHADAELCLMLVSNEKRLMVIIPIKKTSSKSQTGNFFKQISNFNFEDTNDRFSVNNFSLEDLIPQSEFYYYPNVVFSLMGCGKTSEMDAIIFPYDKAITINKNDYDNIASYVGELSNNYNKPLDGQDKSPKDMDDDAIRKSINHKNNHCYDSCKTIDYGKFYINRTGTKNGPGFNDDMGDIMECEAILDENEMPMDSFNRLDWVKNSMDSIDPKFKNYFFLIILCLVITGALVFLHSFVFKEIGKLIGSEDIVTRSSSMS